MKTHYNTKINAFSIVELLVVIVVIGILASIVYIAYVGISQKAIVASLITDLDNASKQLKIFKIQNKNYPTTIDCSSSDSITNLCLKSSKGNVYYYNINKTTKTFGLTAVNDNNRNLSYRVTVDSVPIPCPIGYIVVPGSKTYGTSDFCVMKYEAKDGGDGLPVSTHDGDYLVWFSQLDAIDASKKSCNKCHLISEAEWMTIAQNVLNVKSNWSNGSVGSGYVFNGHSDYDPYNPIATASLDDSDGYFGTGNSSPSSQRRTLTLSNGEVIWDFSGNYSEWTSGQYSSGQPGVDGGGFAWRDYTEITNNGSLPVNPMPSGLNIANSGTWTMADNKIGHIYSNSEYGALFGVRRGGNWLNSGSAGVLNANMEFPPLSSGSDLVFRVVASDN